LSTATAFKSIGVSTSQKIRRPPLIGRAGIFFYVEISWLGAYAAVAFPAFASGLRVRRKTGVFLRLTTAARTGPFAPVPPVHSYGLAGESHPLPSTRTLSVSHCRKKRSSGAGENFRVKDEASAKASDSLSMPSSGYGSTPLYKTE
jgi:hypothetical protein